MINLMHGDCLELMKSIPDKSVDMVLTDPPYGTTACKWDSVIDFKLMWEQLNRIIKDNGAIVLFGSEPFSSALRMSNIKNYKYDWVWEKQKASNFLTASKMPLKTHEIISVFNCNGYYNPQKYSVIEIEDIMSMSKKEMINFFKSREYFKYGSIDRRININNPLKNKDVVGIKVSRERKKDDGTRFPNSVLKFNKNMVNLHPTQKPVSLLEYLIKTYTQDNEIVLDFTMGSGSTGVACLNTNRNFIGIEMDDNYFEIAKSRIENHSLQLNIFES